MPFKEILNLRTDYKKITRWINFSELAVRYCKIFLHN